jgi:hypothetical protein
LGKEWKNLALGKAKPKKIKIILLINFSPWRAK